MNFKLCFIFSFVFLLLFFAICRRGCLFFFSCCCCYFKSATNNLQLFFFRHFNRELNKNVTHRLYPAYIATGMVESNVFYSHGNTVKRMGAITLFSNVLFFFHLHRNGYENNKSGLMFLFFFSLGTCFITNLNNCQKMRTVDHLSLSVELFWQHIC